MSKKKRGGQDPLGELPDNVTFIESWKRKKFFESAAQQRDLKPPEPPLAPVTSLAQFKADKKKK